MSIESMMPSNHLILCRPLLPLPSIFPKIRVFSNEFALHIRWSKYWSFSFSISASNQYSGLISFRTDRFDLLAVQGTSPLPGILQARTLEWVSSPAPQFKSINSSALSLLYRQILTSVYDYWKNHSFEYTDFFGKVMSLLFNMLFRLVIAFLPRSKCLLISRLQSSSAVILEPKKIKSAIVSTISPSICLEMMGLDAMTLGFWMLSFKPAFWLSSFSFIKGFFSSSSLSAIRVMSSVNLRLLTFLLQSRFHLVLHSAWHFLWCLHLS